MKITKILWISLLLCTGFVSAANELESKPLCQLSTTNSPTFGEDKQAVQHFFEDGLSSEFKNRSFTRSIFRLSISESGIVEKAVSVNHSLSEEDELIVLALIHDMKWNQMANPEQIHLVLTIEEGQINVELR